MSLVLWLAMPLLFVGCAKESDYQTAKNRLEDVHLQLRSISSQLNEIQGIQNRFLDLKAQTESLQKEVARLQNEGDKRTESVASLTSQMESIQSQIAALQEARGRDQTAKYSAVELKILGEINQDVVKGENYMAPKEWFTQHASEPGFATVQAMLFNMLQLLRYSTRSMGDEASDPFESATVAGLVKLYNEDPDSAVWVARFWRTKARQGNATYFAAKETIFREDIRKSNGTSEEIEKIRKRYTADMEMELTTYYYDHWKEIREMIMDSLITNEAHRKTASGAESPKK